MRRANRRLLNAVVTAVEVVEATRTRRSADIYTISPADLQAADEVVQRREQEWRRVGSLRRVTDEQVDQALQNAKKLGAEFDQAKRRSRPGLTWAYLNLVRLFVLTGLPGFGKVKVIGGAAFVLCCLSLLSTPFLFRSCGAAFQGAAVLTASGFCLATPAILILWPTEPKRLAYQRMIQQRKEWAERVETLRPAAEQAWTDYNRLQEQWTLYGRLEKARLKRDELAALLTSAKHQLIHMDWRSLRGVDFEHFLSRAFEMLGYRVELTKASGDQGADLIVIGKGGEWPFRPKDTRIASATTPSWKWSPG